MAWRSNVGPKTLEERIAELERRITALERVQQGGGLADSIRLYTRADSMSEAAPPVSIFEPWTSSATQFRNSLTSFDFAKSTLVDIGVCTLGGGVIGIAIAAFGFASPEIAPVSAGLAFVLAGGGFTLHKRSLLGRSLNAQSGRKRQQADRVLHYVNGPEEDSEAPVFRLHISDSIDNKRLSEWAQGVLDGQGLGWRDWTGEGRLFSPGEYASIRSELIKFGFVRDVGGSRGLVLLAVGRLFLRSLII